MHFISSDWERFRAPALAAALLLALCLLAVGAQAMTGPLDTAVLVTGTGEIDHGGAADLPALADTNVTPWTTTPTPTLVSYADAYPRPNFTADRTNGMAPLTVRFTDESSEWAYNWRWTFGDGGSSREQNPVHTFLHPGAYPVILSIYEYDHWSGGTFVHFWNHPITKTVLVIVNDTEPVVTHTVPGRIEAEDYDNGGEGVAYHDTTPGNTGGAYRHDDVDIETAGGITNVGWIRDGENLTYTVNVQSAGNYNMTARVASPTGGQSVELSIDVLSIMDSSLMRVNTPDTGSYTTFKTVSIPVPIYLAAGTHTLKLTFFGDGQNIDWIEFSPQEIGTPTPTPTLIVAVPGGAGTPTDTNADGKYDDVNGNGRSDFNDVVLFFNQMDWIADNEPVASFDFNGNGQIDFNDVVWLFNNFDTPPVRTYTVTAVAIGPGTITPSGRIAVPEGENVTFTMTHEKAMPTPYSTQSGYYGCNLVLVDPTVTPTPFPTPEQWAPWVPNPSNFTPSYTLHDVRSDHTVYSCFYYTMVVA